MKITIYEVYCSSLDGTPIKWKAEREWSQEEMKKNTICDDAPRKMFVCARWLYRNSVKNESYLVQDINNLGVYRSQKI